MKLLREGEKWTVQCEGMEREVALVTLLMGFLGVTAGVAEGPVKLVFSPDTVRALRTAAGRTVQTTVERAEAASRHFTGGSTVTYRGLPVEVAPDGTLRPAQDAIPKLPLRLVKRPKKRNYTERKKGKK